MLSNQNPGTEGTRESKVAEIGRLLRQLADEEPALLDAVHRQIQVWLLDGRVVVQPVLAAGSADLAT